MKGRVKMDTEELARKVLQKILAMAPDAAPQKVIACVGEPDGAMRQSFAGFTLESFGALLGGYEGVLLCGLSVKSLSSLARLAPQTEGEEFALSALLSGKTAYAWEPGLAYRAFMQSAPKALYAKCAGYENDLRQFGVKFISPQSTCAPKALCQRRLVGEKEVEALRQRGETTLFCGPKTIITPLARDLAQKFGISIKTDGANQ